MSLDPLCATCGKRHNKDSRLLCAWYDPEVPGLKTSWKFRYQSLKKWLGFNWEILKRRTMKFFGIRYVPPPFPGD